MTMPALKADIWTAALLRRAQVGGASAYVMRRGDPDAGQVLVKVARLDGAADLYLSGRDMQGARAWRRAASGPEAEADALAQREADFDPDCWIVEIEDRQGRHFLTEPMLED